MEKYKLTIEDMGPAFQRQQLDIQAMRLLNDWRLLVGAGADLLKVTSRMAPDINAFVQQSLRMGQEIPIAMRPVLQAMMDQGLLLDANGDKITDFEGAGITFAQTMTEGFDRIVDKLDELLRGLGLLVKKATDADGLPSVRGEVWAMADAFDGATDSVNTLKAAMAGIPSIPGEDTSGPPVVLGPKAASLYAPASSTTAQTIVVQSVLDGRVVAESTARYLPAAVHRYRVG